MKVPKVFFLMEAPHPTWGFNSRPWDQESRALPNEPARHTRLRSHLSTEFKREKVSQNAEGKNSKTEIIKDGNNHRVKEKDSQAKSKCFWGEPSTTGIETIKAITKEKQQQQK